jgi:hypothetical protein
MFDNWRRRRKLRQEVAKIENEYAPRLINEGDSIRTEFNFKRSAPLNELRRLETEKLQRDIQRFGITAIFASGWKLDARGGEWYLSEEAMTTARNMIKEARYNYWKKWFDLLVPILSFIVSILALLVAIIALKN